MTPSFLKHLLNRAIKGVIANRANYSPDIHNFTRSRKLPLESVVTLLHTMDGGSLAKELHKAGIDATPAAFVQQRHKINPSAFREIMQDFNQSCTDDELYRGYRLLAIDGTSVNLPYNPDTESFLAVDTHPRGGYNALHLSPLYDIQNKIYFDCVIQPKSKMDEQGALIKMLYTNKFDTPTIIIGDRGYESYNIFAHIISRPNVDFVIRVKQGKSAMRDIAKLPMIELDKDISLTITTSQSKAHREAGYILMQMSSKKGHKYRARWDFSHINPFPMQFRVVRFLLPSGEYETLVTSLPRSRFGILELKELYRKRWGIETSFRTLKYCTGLINIHSKSDKFVEQEVYAALTMFNFCNRISREVVIQQNKLNIHEYKVNLTMAIFLCKEFFRDAKADPEKLVHDIAKHIEPVRPGRADQRNIKAKGFVGFTYRVAA